MPTSKPPHELPLFPLPHLLFYPGRILPLHIFEPRYRALMKDALKRDRRFAMATLKPGWEADYEGRPEIYPFAVVGRVTKYRELEDGGFVLHLIGESRAMILGEKQGKPYRVGKLQILEEIPFTQNRECAVRAELERTLYEVCGRLPMPPRPECDNSEGEECFDVVSLVNEAILTLPMPLPRKLELLATNCHATRVRSLTETLHQMIHRRVELRRAERLVPQDLRWN